MIVRFIAHFGSYNVGERADFDEAFAQNLISRRIAVDVTKAMTAPDLNKMMESAPVAKDAPDEIIVTEPLTPPDDDAFELGAVKAAYRIEERGRGWYDVVDADGVAQTPNAMRRQDAEEMLRQIAGE